MKRITTIEIVEEYEKGKRDFSDSLLDIVTLESMDLRGIIFRNCDITQIRFIASNLEEADFSGSKILYGNFDQTNLKKAKFNNCTIEWTRLNSAIFNDTEMKNSNLSYVSMLNSAIGSLDLTNTSQHRLITDLSQITKEDIEKMLEVYGERINKSDFETRIRIRNIVNNLLKEYSKGEKVVIPKKDENNKKESFRKGYAKLTQVLDSISYGTDNKYKQKHPYKKENEYDK